MKELLPPRTAVNAPYWDGLEQGILQYQQCETCAHCWLPPRAECPNCLSDVTRWVVASGDAKLISWVVYRVALHPHFADQVPYAVGVVELAEGPRLPIRVDPDTDLHIDIAGDIVFREDGGANLPVFRPSTRRRDG